jgi:hypothetical protein
MIILQTAFADLDLETLHFGDQSNFCYVLFIHHCNSRRQMLQQFSVRCGHPDDINVPFVDIKQSRPPSASELHV